MGVPGTQGVVTGTAATGTVVTDIVVNGGGYLYGGLLAEDYLEK